MRNLEAFLILFTIFATSAHLSAQRKLTFLAADKLEVTADLYLYDSGAPYIILFHQENSSRGEYKEIAPRLQKFGFNCLAVDLRNGKECNFVHNETAASAQTNNIPASLLDCEKDILAAMAYIEKTAINNRYILLGSSFSASLAIKVANNNRNVAAVIAFSPGEYFGAVKAKEWLKDFNQSLYITSAKREQPFVNEFIKDMPAQHLTLFQPQGNGVHGAPILWNNSESSSECWMSLMMFVNRIKEERY